MYKSLAKNKNSVFYEFYFKALSFCLFLINILAVNASVETVQWKGVDNQDAISVPVQRFNWYKHREIKNSAQELCDKISTISVVVKSSLDIFSAKEKEIEELLKAFYIDIALKLGFKGDISRAEKDLIINIDSLREQLQGVKTHLPEDNREDKKHIAEYEIELENSKLWVQNLIRNIGLIQSAHASLLKSIDVLKEQVALVQEHESNAFGEYQKLDELISDYQAHEFLKNIRMHLKNSEIIKEYVYNQYVNFFNQAIQKIVDASKLLDGEALSVINKINFLKANVMHEVNLAEEKKNALKKEEEEIARKDAERARIEFERKQKELADQQRPFYIKIIYGIGNFFSSLYNSIKNFIISIFVKEKHEVRPHLAKTQTDNQSEHKELPKPVINDDLLKPLIIPEVNQKNLIQHANQVAEKHNATIVRPVNEAEKHLKSELEMPVSSTGDPYKTISNPIVAEQKPYIAKPQEMIQFMPTTEPHFQGAHQKDAHVVIEEPRAGASWYPAQSAQQPSYDLSSSRSNMPSDADLVTAMQNPITPPARPQNSAPAYTNQNQYAAAMSAAAQQNAANSSAQTTAQTAAANTPTTGTATTSATSTGATVATTSTGSTGGGALSKEEQKIVSAIESGGTLSKAEQKIASVVESATGITPASTSSSSATSGSSGTSSKKH